MKCKTLKETEDLYTEYIKKYIKNSDIKPLDYYI